VTIVGVLGADDDEASRVLEDIASGLGERPDTRTVKSGVALASWADVASSPRLQGDLASVGSLEGDVPGPGAELRGDFATIARRAGGLRLGRGRFGGRPLYWMRRGATVVASSRMLPLALAARGELRINLDYLCALFEPVLQVVHGPFPFEGGQVVRANTLVDIDRAGARTIEGPVRFEPELRLSTRELAREVRDQFRAAVARQSAGARCIGVMTGGGIDSSNLLAAAVANHRERGGPRVVPLAFDYGGEGDDRPHLRALCQRLGVEPIRVGAADGAAFGMRDRVVDGRVQQLLPAASMSALMARAKAAGVDRIFDGVDSEAVFDCDSGVFADLLFHEPLAALGIVLRYRTITENLPQSWRRMVVGPLARRVLPRFVVDRRARHMRARLARARTARFPWAGPRLAAFLANPELGPGPRPVVSQRGRVAHLASAPYLMDNRESASRWEIVGGVPIARPYLDDEFLRFMARVPSRAIFAGARERGLLRESMTGCVPESLRNRMDKARPRELLADALGHVRDTPALRDLLSMRELEAVGIIDPPAFRAAFEAFTADPLRDDTAWAAMGAALSGEAYLRWSRELVTARGTAPGGPAVARGSASGPSPLAV
jgi:hypothetical protein